MGKAIIWELDIPSGAKPIGYRFLYEHFRLRVIGHYRWSYTGPGWESEEFKYEHSYVQQRLYPKLYEAESDPIKHVEFALKQEILRIFHVF